MAGNPLDQEDIINKGLIGKGAFGAVFLVENKNSHEEFAIKVMEIDRCPISDREVAENELRVLLQLSHENVLAYVSHFISQGMMYIITEYCQGGDLSGFLDQLDTGRPSPMGLPEDLLLVWLWQIACGLEYMHTFEPTAILHRDLKPSNIYLTGDGNVRLGDMGIARILDDRPDAMAQTFCGTPPYMSPEALYEKPYNAKTDIWSLGCCVVEMATLNRAYDGSTLYILRNAVLKQREPLPLNKYSHDLDGLVGKMLVKDYEDRLSATQLLDELENGYYVVKLGLENGMPSPMDLLDMHQMIGYLAMYRDDTSCPGTRFVPSVSPSGSHHDLTPSMSNIRYFLGPGETMKQFHVKVHKRIKNRPIVPDDTITQSSSLKTVLATTTQTVTKVKKTPMPALKLKTSKNEKSEETEPPEAMPSSVLANVTSSFCSKIGTRNTQTSSLPQGGAQAHASRVQNIATMRQVLIEVTGRDAFDRATRLVSSDAPSAKIWDGLRSMLDLPSVVESEHMKLWASQIIFYFVLMDFAENSLS